MTNPQKRSFINRWTEVGLCYKYDVSKYVNLSDIYCPYNLLVKNRYSNFTKKQMKCLIRFKNIIISFKSVLNNVRFVDIREEPYF